MVLYGECICVCAYRCELNYVEIRLVFVIGTHIRCQNIIRTYKEYNIYQQTKTLDVVVTLMSNNVINETIFSQHSIDF